MTGLNNLTTADHWRICIRRARYWLQVRPDAITLFRGRECLDNAEASIRLALGIANKMRDRKRAALCLRILNWIRADIARTV